MNLRTRLSVGVVATGTNVLDIANATDPLKLFHVLEWASGTGADQADSSWHDSQSVSANSSNSLNFASGGGLTDAFGAAVAMARFRAVYFRNTGSVVLGVAHNGEITGGGAVPVRPGGVYHVIAPDATGYATAGGFGTFDIENASLTTAGTYDLVVIGATA